VRLAKDQRSEKELVIYMFESGGTYVVGGTEAVAKHILGIYAGCGGGVFVFPVTLAGSKSRGLGGVLFEVECEEEERPAETKDRWSHRRR
jgi:hypothetical protein